ncbi:uncharacterized protein DUF4091 [Bacteroides zoogleoformans]|uniref:Glycoside hydrolase 123 C-terminal domain-containing protein n=2 Tax=Bacteroides zoogleoformans TaxID=28119 RepID=A0ABM6TAK2_9BACE|nr:hypothetical protein C4H11_12990 [Bacteroides zoogleoformans]TWJ18105.1 uncharacterized protein DUF4091 [Bacteroides zoogleoformans]
MLSMRKILLALLCEIVFFTSGFAQNKSGVTLSGQPTGQAPFPLSSYKELPDPTPTDRAVWHKVKGINLSWGDTHVRYKKEVPAPITGLQKGLELTAWRGERISAQWVVWADRPLAGLSISMGDLVHSNKKDFIKHECILSGFVRYVMTDELNKDGNGGCGVRPDAAAFDSTLVADPIDHLPHELDINPYTTQGGWLSIRVPQDATPGIYHGTVTVKEANGEIGTLNLRINVKERVLPQPSDWKFHLDLWQNPFAIARYHQVPFWSHEHLEYMRPYMELYRDAGGKVITTSIMHKPWNGQTYDYFETMVTWIKKADGTWSFDYTVFDRWVEFMMGLGITKEINCYSMVPWRLSFQYFDQATNSLREIQTKPGEPAYEEMWLAMLKSFSAHLKEKGWFSITHISMDERPMEVMKETLKVIRKADPDFKVSLAGALHETLSDDLHDYCVALRMKYPEEMKVRRKAEGKVTTFYTCCEEPYPNTFTFSPPAESEWLGWYAAKEGLDGYLRWAYNSWVIEPLLDSRFSAWAAGDTYLIYPGARSSLRFEHLIAGIQAFEKIRILKEEYTRTNNRAGLKRIEKALKLFDESTLRTTPASAVIKQAKAIINE